MSAASAALNGLLGNEAQTSSVDDARFLAEWTRLDTPTLLALYRALVRRPEGRQLRSSNVVLRDEVPGAADEPLRSRLALCREVQRAGLLDEFCLAVVGNEADRDDRRPDHEVDVIVDRIVKVGRLQGITERARGFCHPVMFGRLDQIYKATGYIKDAAGRIRGTTFLVGRDRVITAAHVVLRRDAQDGTVSFDPPLPEGLQVVFPATPMQEQRAGLHKTSPLLAYALPLANSAGKLIVNFTEMDAAATRLDYAVLLLDRPIIDVKPVSIEGMTNLDLDKLSFVIGYPKGTQPLCDGDLLREVLRDGQRIVHMMNAVAGMSGSCCVANDGVAVGLHEGEWSDGLNAEGNPQVRNRAVMLQAIKADIDRRSPGALRAGFASGGALIDRLLVQRLGKRGQQLAGSDTARTAWDALYQRTLGTHPSAAEAPDWDRHPFFTQETARKSVEAWFTAAAERNTGERILAISGPAGSGKTFCIDRLAARLDEPVRDLVRVDNFAGAMAVEAFEVRLGIPSNDAETRTTPGQVRYERVEAIIGELARFGGRDRELHRDAHPIFMAIDAGTETEASLAADDWLVLLRAVAARPWARIVVCGLSDLAIYQLEEALAADPATQTLAFTKHVLSHARPADIRAVIAAWPLPGGVPPFDPNKVAAQLDPTLAHLGGAESLRTAVAALLCIAAVIQ